MSLSMIKSSQESIPSSLRAFSIPELVCLICGFSKKHDNVALLRVCRHLYNWVTPFVWSSVSDAIHLIQLIPGVELNTSHDDLFSPCTSLVLPETLDLTRFNIFAPHVKQLGIRTPEADLYENWELFISNAQSMILLPNLELICYQPSSKVTGRCVQWISAFLSPSVLGFHMSKKEATSMSIVNDLKVISKLELVSVLLSLISSQCPKLESIQVFPTRLQHTLIGLFRSLPSPREDVPSRVNSIAFYIKSLVHLRSISSNEISINPDVFLALSRLPCLESMTVCGEGSFGDLPALPQDSFPALRHLALHDFYNYSIRPFLDLQPLVQNLESLEFYFWSSYNEYEHPATEDFEILMKILARNKSLIHTLQITSSSKDSIYITSGTIRAFQCLPLRSLHLPHHTFYGGDATLEYLLLALPHIEELYFSVCQPFYFSFHHLRLLSSQLPHLRILRLGLSGSVPDVAGHDIENVLCETLSPMILCSCLELEEPRNQSAQAIARYLYSLWPNVTYSLFSEGHIDRIHVEDRHLIQRSILALREKRMM